MDGAKQNGMQQEKLEITYLANTGLLISYRGTNLLLDALYGTEPHAFSSLPQGVYEDMLQGKPPFDRLSCLLFTHLHPDHFSPQMAEALLKKRPKTGLFLPDISGQALDAALHAAYQSLLETVQKQKIPCALLTKKTDSAIYHIGEHIKVRAFHTAHLDDAYQDVQHVCYLLSFDGREVLFTADLDYVHETLWQVAAPGKERKLTAVFVNPLFFHELTKPRFFKQQLDTECLVVYHVPFPKDDAMRMLPMLERDAAAFSGRQHKNGQAMHITVLSAPFQRVFL